ncbi:MAG: methyltransferase domain-containing protein [Pseudomonadota bacterium]
MSESLADLLACPRCDKTPLSTDASRWRCDACKLDFPALDGIPFLFAEPDATLGEWRNRLNFAARKMAHESARLEVEEKDKALRPLTKRRLERYRKSLDAHRRKLAKLLQPLDIDAQAASYESYLALRTRLPSDQGLNTYYPNIHRDWAWGDEENAASLKQLRNVLHDNAELGDVLVVGAGAGRLAYDIHMQLDCRRTVAIDFNPMLMLVAKAVTGGQNLPMYEFPIAPRSLDDDAVLRQLEAPEPVRDGFELVLGDALRLPFAAASFDTIVTPWLIDIVTEELGVFAARLNRLLKPEGRWLNFGSLAFHHARRALQYSADETKTIVAECGFSDPYVAEATIPYMSSPASRHARQERVFSFCAYKEREVKTPARHKALPDWLVTGKEAVPLLQNFRTQAMTTQIYSFIMSLIDGKRSIDDMAKVLEKQQLMPKAEAVPAIRAFLTKMFDDANQQSNY